MPDDIMLSPAEMFLKYDYPETKDMSKQFLTLIATVLVISITFSEKILHFTEPTKSSKWIVFSSWLSLLLAIIFCGTGLLFVTIAAGAAAYSPKNWEEKNRGRVKRAFNMIIAAGGLFILGLVFLIWAAIAVTYQDTTSKSQKTNITTIKLANYSICELLYMPPKRRRNRPD